MADRLAEIKARLGEVASPPWFWRRNYELADADGDLAKHWALYNAKSEAEGKCLAWETVLFTSSPTDFGDRRLDETPYLRFIANAPSDVAYLLDSLDDEYTVAEDRLKTITELRAALGACIDAIDYCPGGIAGSCGTVPEEYRTLARSGTQLSERHNDSNQEKGNG